MELHPLLADLDTSYRKLVDDVSAGRISIEDAQIVLEHTKVADGDGALWSIDPQSGDFVRTVPGQQSTFADPQMFVGSVLPPIPFNGPEEFTGIPDGHPGAYAGPPSLAPIAPDSTITKLKKKKAARQPSSGAALTKAKGMFKGKIRSLVIPGIAIIVVLYIIVGGDASSGGDTSGEKPNQSGVINSTIPVPVTISVPGVAVVPTLPPVDPSAPVVISVAPTVKNLTSISTILTSGKVAAVGKLVDNDVAVLKDVLGLLGSKRAGFKLSFGECLPIEQNWVCSIVGEHTDGETISWDLSLRMLDKDWIITKATLKTSE